MNVKLLYAVVALTLTVLVKAELDYETIMRYFLIQHTIQNQGKFQCAKYGHACSDVLPCCRYNNLELKCFDGTCLQAVCGYPQQTCGPLYGECCYHLQLTCQGVDAFSGVCTPQTTAVL